MYTITEIINAYNIGVTCKIIYFVTIFLFCMFSFMFYRALISINFIHGPEYMKTKKILKNIIILTSCLLIFTIIKDCMYL